MASLSIASVANCLDFPIRTLCLPIEARQRPSPYDFYSCHPRTSAISKLSYHDDLNHRRSSPQLEGESYSVPWTTNTKPRHGQIRQFPLTTLCLQSQLTTPTTPKSNKSSRICVFPIPIFSGRRIFSGPPPSHIKDSLQLPFSISLLHSSISPSSASHLHPICTLPLPAYQPL